MITHSTNSIGHAHKVVLIGGDHYNGLSLVRLFGKKGLTPYGIIIGEKSEDGFLRESKYWSNVWAIENDDLLVDTLLALFPNEAVKPVLVPWSDGAALAIDTNQDTLSDKFIVPSINGRQGAVAELMDKEKQIAFAHQCDLPVAWTTEIELGHASGITGTLPFPCIGKPVRSIEGKKKDIRICANEDELARYLEFLSAEGYQRILIQEYLAIDAEYDVEGFVHDDFSSYYAVEKIRTWPAIGGPTSYAFSIDDSRLNAVMNEIIGQLKTMGYSGLFDVELFRVGEQFMFNEINWRNSAVCFAALADGVDYPLYWYEAVTGAIPSIGRPKRYSRTVMCELLDIHNVFEKRVKPSDWITQLVGCHARAFLDPSDLRPVVKRMMTPLLRRRTNE